MSGSQDIEPLARRVPPPHWSPLKHPSIPPGTRGWTYAGLVVISGFQSMEAPDGSGEAIPQWHISVSRRGRRPSDRDVARALEAFRMTGAEEDNHHPGVARHYFLVVDPARRVDCECKAGEAVVVEPGGYRWSNDVKNCRGCEFQRLLGTPCPIHTAPREATR